MPGSRCMGSVTPGRAAGIGREARGGGAAASGCDFAGGGAWGTGVAGAAAGTCVDARPDSVLGCRGATVSAGPRPSGSSATAPSVVGSGVEGCEDGGRDP